MIRFILAVLLFVAVAAVVFAVGRPIYDSWSATNSTNPEIAALQQQNTALQQKIDQLIAAPAKPADAPAIPTTAPAPPETTSTLAAPAPTAIYALPPQPYLPHPSLYVETGKPDVLNPSSDNTKTWKTPILEGTVAIVGGFSVDGLTNGAYKAIVGPAQLDVTVTDGFLSIVKSQWGQNEWTFRIGEAITYCWARTHLTPLDGWTTPSGTNTDCNKQAAAAAPAPVVAPTAKPIVAAAAPAPVVTPTAKPAPAPVVAPTAKPAAPIAPKPAVAPAVAAAKPVPAPAAAAPDNRKTSGIGKTIPFAKGDSVLGFKIVLDNNGTTYESCLLTNAQSTGKVTDGVVWPNAQEQSQAKACN